MDIAKIPFSYRGSYMAVSYCEENSWGFPHPAGLYLRTVSGSAPSPFVLRIQPLWDHRPAQFQTSFDGKSLDLRLAQGTLTFCFADAQTILCTGAGKEIGLRLDQISCPDSCNYVHRVIPDSASVVCINCYKNFTRHLVMCPSGTVEISQDWDREEAHDCQVDVTAVSGSLTVFLREAYDTIDLEQPLVSVDQAWCKAEASLAAFLPLAERLPKHYRKAARTAAYVQWASLVEPRGNLRREAMLMSKNWMTSVWAWDHCFNALALCGVDDRLAWIQFMLPFEYQRQDGLIPDFVNDALCFFNCVKLPIHGWALRRMMRYSELSAQQLEQAYQKLSSWTRWWFTQRDQDGDGLCEYWHGNDSGWDNSTVFSRGPCVISPELNAFLVVQMDVLSELAIRLKKTDEAHDWSHRAERTAEILEKALFVNGIPTPLEAQTRTPIPQQSLLPYLSLIAGYRLSPLCREQMKKMLLSDAFLTPYGYATEMCASPSFEEDGYWRGAVWAPVMCLLTDALEENDAPVAARHAAECFCTMAAEYGFAENYSALTGRGLRDPAYTWAASVFLEFLKTYFTL